MVSSTEQNAVSITLEAIDCLSGDDLRGQLRNMLTPTGIHTPLSKTGNDLIGILYFQVGRLMMERNAETIREFRESLEEVMESFDEHIKIHEI